MLKKSITYTDFNNNEVTENFYFHLSKADLIEMEMSHKGGYEKWLKEIISAEDGATIMAEFKKLILSSYGQKSEDGKRFIKSRALCDEFVSSEAYSQLFMELVTDAVAASEFVNGIVPQGLDRDIAKLKANQPGEFAGLQTPNSDSTETARNVFDTPEPTAENPRFLTPDEVAEMDSDELKSRLATGQYKLS